MPDVSASGRELWMLGIAAGTGREELLCTYLAAGGYRCRLEKVENLASGRPLGVILDISPFSDDGWGQLLKIKKDPVTRNIPVLLVFLSELGKVGGIFPVAGFFTLPVEENYLLERLAVYGMTEDAETWDLQALVVSRLGKKNCPGPWNQQDSRSSRPTRPKRPRHSSRSTRSIWPLSA